MFYRLLVVADDYGHMDGRTAILKAQCFPLKDTATVARIETWVAGLVAKTMLAPYEVDGNLYLAMCRWEARVRTHPKYPLPPDGSNLFATCAQTADRLPPGLGLGLGKGLGAPTEVSFDAAAGRFAVPDLMQSQWAKAYPAVDLDTEIAKAAAWLLANPKNAKSNYARFLTNWLTKAQDKAGAKGGGRGTPSMFEGAL